jgi:hypothetical protein
VSTDEGPDFAVQLFWELMDDGKMRIAISTPLEKLGNFDSPGDMMQGFLNVLRWVGGLDIRDTESIRTRINKNTRRAMVQWIGPAPAELDESLIALQIATAAERTNITVHGG